MYIVRLQAVNYTSFSLGYALELEEKLAARDAEVAALREQLEEAKAELAAVRRPAAEAELEKSAEAGAVQQDLLSSVEHALEGVRAVAR